MNKNILISLKKKMTELTYSQRIVADYIIKNPVESAFITIEQLAKVVGTSTGTIVRLAISLDYSGYSDFQRALQTWLKSRSAPQDRLNTNLQELDNNDLLQKNMEMQIENIRSSANQLDNEEFEQVLSDILQAERVYVSGARTGYSAAYYLYYGLNRILGKCDQLIPGAGELPEKIAMITPKDVIISITSPRYARPVYEITEMAKDQGAKVISITDGYSSPLAKYSDIIIPCQFGSMAFHNSFLAAMFLADHIISSIAIKNDDETKKKLKKMEQILTKMNVHVDKLT